MFGGEIKYFIIGGFRRYNSEKDAGDEHNFIFDKYGDGLHKTDFRQFDMTNDIKWWKGTFDGYQIEYWHEVLPAPVIEP